MVTIGSAGIIGMAVTLEMISAAPFRQVVVFSATGAYSGSRLRSHQTGSFRTHGGTQCEKAAADGIPDAHDP